MGQEQPASWYNRTYAESTSYALPPDKAPWAPLWYAVAERLLPTERVVDIGCGPGHMAQILRDKVRLYIGLDFSGEAIRRARLRVPGVTFRCRDARSYDLPDADTYLFLEVLEHVTEDIEILSKIEPGKRVLLSVPNHDGESHVRHFKTGKAVYDRFGGVLNIREITSLGKWFICEGVRR